MGSNEAESKSPLQPANTANVADSLPPATPPLFALRRGDSSPRLAVASRKRALGSPSLGSFFFCRRTGRHPARITVHRSSRTVPQPRRSLRRGCWAWPPQSLVRRAASIDACRAPCFLAWGSIHNQRPRMFHVKHSGSQPKQTAPSFALMRRGSRISPQEQQGSGKNDAGKRPASSRTTQPQRFAGTALICSTRAASPHQRRTNFERTR